MSSAHSKASGWSKSNASRSVERAVAEVDVVRVELDQRQVARAGQLGEAFGDRGLARRRAAGHPDQERPRGEGVHGIATVPRRRRCARPAGARLRCRRRRACRGPAETAGGRTHDRRTRGARRRRARARRAAQPRVGDGGSPVGSTLSIVLAVVAVVAGFLILRAITDDDDGGGHDHAGAGHGVARSTRRAAPVRRPIAGTSGGVTTTVAPLDADQGGRHRARRQRQRDRRLGRVDGDGAADRRLHRRGADQQHRRAAGDLGRLLRRRQPAGPRGRHDARRPRSSGSCPSRCRSRRRSSRASATPRSC